MLTEGFASGPSRAAAMAQWARIPGGIARGGRLAGSVAELQSQTTLRPVAR